MPLNLKPLSQCRVLIVDDDEIIRVTLEAVLEEHFKVDTLTNGLEIDDFYRLSKPDLIILDVNLPQINGLEICKKLRQSADYANIPIIFITSSSDVDSQNACWEAGGTDFISKPVIASTLIHRTKNHLENKLRLEKLAELTYKDSLTGLYNRHYLEQEVVNALKLSDRDKTPFSILMIDIDFFKLYNDKYGHLQGDKCIKEIAAVLLSVLKRPQDMAVRFGGEEFLVVLPDTDYAGMKHISDHIRSQLCDLNITHSESAYEQVTLSIGGVTRHPPTAMTLQAGISAADEHLYEAKRSGRNGYVFHKIESDM